MRSVTVGARFEQADGRKTGATGGHRIADRERLS
jgi:hypothetical protein